MAEHLLVPVEQICEVKPASSNSREEDGITEEVDRILADKDTRKRLQTWEGLWGLLFPQDTAVLDPGRFIYPLRLSPIFSTQSGVLMPCLEFQPAIEMVEMEQELDDSQAELKADLRESLQRLLPNQTDDVCFFLAGQFQLVFEQHRAKVNRKCRLNAESSSALTSSIEKSKGNPSRFSIRNIEGVVSKNHIAQGANQQASPKSKRPRQSQVQPIALKTNITPATSSSVYSVNSNASSSSNSKPPTRSSTLSTVGIQVESPRLPFRDWVQGIKFSNNNKNSQRDSGLAMDQCEECKMEPCQCESYADQLSAFITPAANQESGLLPPYEMASQGSDESEIDWAAQYDGRMLSAGVPLLDSAVEARGRNMGLSSGNSDEVHQM